MQVMYFIVSFIWVNYASIKKNLNQSKKKSDKLIYQMKKKSEKKKVK